MKKCFSFYIQQFDMETKANIRSEAAKVLARIAAFLVYYLLLIALGGIIFIVAFFFTKYMIIYVFPEIGSGRLLILLLLAILGVWALAGMFGLYLIKPLFSFSKNVKAERVEITQEDCPELFSMIYDLADSVKCKRPKHVYLTTAVNACVFYDTSFWSIFFPVRKNLEIGLGLFDGTSTEEVKAILAHEFGHFSQNSMKVGSTVYVTNSVLYNLIYEEDWWDRLLDKWERSDTSIFRWFGHITRALTNGIKKLNFRMYRFVQKAYLKLSRQMEFDADNISCSIVGKEAFISAMCKIDILSDEDSEYRDFVNALLNENKLVGNYFTGRRVADSLNPDKSIPELKFDVPMTAPLNNVKSPSRVEVKNVWASHPSLKDRLANAEASGFSSKNTTPIPSWSLVSDDIQKKVSDKLFSLIQQDPEHPITIVDDSEFASWTKKYISENYVPLELRPFLSRDIIEFDRDNLPEVDSTPLSDENAQILSDYETAKQDLQIMQGVLNGEISAKELSYDGVVYKKKQIPIEQHKAYVEGLFEKAKNIDASIYKFLLDNVQEDNQGILAWAYDSLFYVKAFYPELVQMQQKRDSWYEELTRPTRRDQDEYDRLCSYIADFEQFCRGMIKKSKWELLRPEVGEESEKQMLAYAETAHNTPTSINTDEINTLFRIIDVLVNMHDGLYGRARKTIGKLLQELNGNNVLSKN